MKTLLCLVFTLGSLATCHAQGNNIYQQLFTNASGTTTSAVARNIGQQYHRIDVFLSGGSCVNGSTGEIYLEGSADGTSYITITPPLTNLQVYSYPGSAYRFHGSASASGAYAYVRASYKATYSNCLLTLNYSGSVSGTPSGSQPFVSGSDTFSYINGTYAVAAAPLTVAQCVGSAALQTYAILLTAPGGVNTVTLNVDNGSLDQWNQKFPLAATGIVSLPQGSRPYFFSNAMTSTTYNLRITLSAATEVNYQIAYRCE